MMNYENLFAEFSSMHVAVIGDVMLDTYQWGNVDRISPEAPVPVVVMHHRENRMGGAGNVALNTVSLAAQTTLFSVTGNDDEAKTLITLLQQHNINTKYIIQSDKRITTNKTRVMSRNQQMLRLDSEITDDISESDETRLLKNFSSYINENKPAVVIFEDYNKGVLTPRLVQSIIKICKANNIITAADPKRKNFFAYKHVDIFKPNLKEVKDGLNMMIDDISPALLDKIHTEIYRHLQHTISLITLSEKGIFIHDEKTANIIPAHVRNIADVSGAGDTVIAVAALMYAAAKDIMLAAEIANLAGGIVCEEVGTVAISKEKLLQECSELIIKNSGNTFPSIH